MASDTTAGDTIHTPSSRLEREKHTIRPSTNIVSTNRSPLYFWSETNAKTGYLSQWHSGVPFYDPSEPVLKVYKTAEHYMMHHKAILFGDVATGAEILEAGHPPRAKDLGRSVQGFNEEIWTAHRERIVRRASWCKFTCPVEDGNAGFDAGGGDRVWRLGKCPDAREFSSKSFRTVLLNTGSRELIEASPHDRIWGIGYGVADAGQNRDTWGLNLLGKVLMSVRDEFRRMRRLDRRLISANIRQHEGLMES